MSKELEMVRAMINGANEYEKKTGDKNPPVYFSRNNLLIIENALQRLEAIDNANPSEALECWQWIDATIPQWVREKDKERPNVLEPIKQALLKAQEPKQYLKWEDLEFTSEDQTIKVKMGDTIYKVVYRCCDGIKEVQLLSEDEKFLYFNYIGNFKDNIQFFNDLRLERVEE